MKRNENNGFSGLTAWFNGTHDMYTCYGQCGNFSCVNLYEFITYY